MTSQEPQSQEDTSFTCPLPFHCPTSCPNRANTQLGKGYSYLFAVALTGFLASQAISLNANDEYWEVSIEPVPAHVYLPTVALITSVLGFNTDKIAQAFGVLLSKGGSKES